MDDSKESESDQAEPAAKETPEEKILRNLLKSGFPFEAMIARCFSGLPIEDEWKDSYVSDIGSRPMDDLGGLNKGVPVSCGVPFKDPVEGKTREIDVHSIIPLEIKGARLDIHFLVQCKDTDRLWCFGHYGFESRPSIRDKFVNVNIQPKSREAELEYSILISDPVLNIDPHALCGLGRVYKKSEEDEKHKDEIWEACVTAVKSAVYYKKISEGLTVMGHKGKIFYLFIPMVATSNLLYFADLSKDPPEVQRVASAFYSYEGLEEDGVTRHHFTVPIITEESLVSVVHHIVQRSIKFLEDYFAW
jgi:hypothetical protein